jgi:ATP phosphoribosyltransferase
LAEAPLKLVLPKGRIAASVLDLLAAVGWRVEGTERSYRPRCAVPGVEVKLLKPQNIPTLLALGRHDLGFAGHDWVLEQEASVDEVLDTGLDRVRLVAAVPAEIRERWTSLGRPLVVASEYERLARRFVDRRGLRDAVVLRTHGATEVYPPEDADMIVDNVATGETLRQNGLVEVETILESSTRMLAWPGLRATPARRERVEQLVDLVRGVLLARRKVLLEMNVPADRLDALVKALPAMRSPTVAPLHGGGGYAVKIAVDRDQVRDLVPKIKALGAGDILEYTVAKIVP